MMTTNATPSLLDIVTHTPSWVWIVFAGLIWMGISRSRDRDIRVQRLALMPVVAVCLALYGLLSSFSLASLGGLVIGASGGLITGLILERQTRATRLDNGRIRLKGDWSGLLVLMAIFLTRYVVIVTTTIAPLTAVSDGFHATTGLISGFFAAMLCARTVRWLQAA